MYKITEGIYQGGIPQTDLPPEIDAVVTLNDRIHRMPHLKAHLIMSVPDGEFPGLKWLETVVRSIDNFRKGGMNVYIHCQAGISRSTMVTAAYLMAKHGMSRDKALEKIGAVNPDTDPNPRFMRGLKEWENQLTSRE